MSNVVALPVANAYDPTKPVPSFILPPNLNDLSDEQIDQILEHIRTVRLVAHHRFNDSKKLRNTAEVNRLSVRFDRVMATMAKELDKFDKYEEKLTKAANDLRALRLQLGSDPL